MNRPQNTNGCADVGSAVVLSPISFDQYLSFRLNIIFWISNQARLPAEFKHITKRRKRN
jgi:hypothetical protein